MALYVLLAVMFKGTAAFRHLQPAGCQVLTFGEKRKSILFRWSV